MDPPQKKVVVESKIKGPKRLGQANRALGTGKKKHQQTADSDEIEEHSDIMLDGSGIPTDVHSVSYSSNFFFNRTHCPSIVDSILEILFTSSNGSFTKTSIESSTSLD